MSQEAIDQRRENTFRAWTSKLAVDRGELTSSAGMVWKKKKDRIALGTSRQLLSVLVGLGWDGDLMKKTKRLNEDQGVFAVDSIF